MDLKTRREIHSKTIVNRYFRTHPWTLAYCSNRVLKRNLEQMRKGVFVKFLAAAALTSLFLFLAFAQNSFAKTKYAVRHDCKTINCLLISLNQVQRLGCEVVEPDSDLSCLFPNGSFYSTNCVSRPVSKAGVVGSCPNGSVWSRVSAATAPGKEKVLEGACVFISRKNRERSSTRSGTR